MGMIQRAREWVGGFGVLESGRKFSQAMQASKALREVDAAAERELSGDSEPPPPAASEARDSGPDVLDGLSMGAHP